MNMVIISKVDTQLDDIDHLNLPILPILCQQMEKIASYLLQICNFSKKKKKKYCRFPEHPLSLVRQTDCLVPNSHH